MDLVADLQLAGCYCAVQWLKHACFQQWMLVCFFFKWYPFRSNLSTLAVLIIKWVRGVKLSHGAVIRVER